MTIFEKISNHFKKMLTRASTKATKIILKKTILKQLNISYELGHLMNLEQESIEVEPGVKGKVCVIRGCLMLLQELTNNLRNSEKQVSVRMTIFVLVCASLLFLFSTLLALRHLLFLSSSS